MVRYSFLVRLFHPRLSAGFDRRFHGVPGIQNVQKWRSRNQMGNLKYRASTGQTPTAHRQPDDKNVEFR
jgi:hypothetical protein